MFSTHPYATVYWICKIFTFSSCPTLPKSTLLCSACSYNSARLFYRSSGEHHTKTEVPFQVLQTHRKILQAVQKKLWSKEQAEVGIDHRGPKFWLSELFLLINYWFTVVATFISEATKTCLEMFAWQIQLLNGTTHTDSFCWGLDFASSPDQHPHSSWSSIQHK